MEELAIKIFSDGANIDEMIEDLNGGIVTGFTTNPSLMKKAGVTSYLDFAQKVLAQIKEYPVSFEVFSDDISVMKEEALRLSSLGDNVYVKIPITNSKGESTLTLIK